MRYKTSGVFHGIWIISPTVTRGYYLPAGYVDEKASWPLPKHVDGMHGYQRCTYSKDFHGGQYHVADVHLHGPIVYFGEPITKEELLDPFLIQDLKVREQVKRVMLRNPKYKVTNAKRGQLFVMTQGLRLYPIRDGDLIEPLSREEYASGKITISHYGGDPVDADAAPPIKEKK